MSEMVERLALRLCEIRSEDPRGAECRVVDGEWRSVTFIEKARWEVRHLLEAMREPTDEMEAAYEASGDVLRTGGYSAMIDAALK